MAANRKYVIITPVRDEEEYIEKTLHSVISQTIRPAEWIIINDGSTDNTGNIIDNYVRMYSWIKAKHRKNRGHRKAGGGVVEAFYDGYNALEVKSWEFLVKLDGDLSFGKEYFEECFAKFAKTPKLGIGGGVIYQNKNGSHRVEHNPIFHVRGATKIYRRACWEAIGSLISAPGWDTVDEVKANMLGWETRSFADLKVIHHRPTGMVDGRWRDAVKNGMANYVAGYHPVFLLVKSIGRLYREPYIIGSLGLLFGFLKAYWTQSPKVSDEDLIEYIRRQQIRRLTFRSTIWK